MLWVPCEGGGGSAHMGAALPRPCSPPHPCLALHTLLPGMLHASAPHLNLCCNRGLRVSALPCCASSAQAKPPPVAPRLVALGGAPACRRRGQHHRHVQCRQPL